MYRTGSSGIVVNLGDFDTLNAELPESWTRARKLDGMTTEQHLQGAKFHRDSARQRSAVLEQQKPGSSETIGTPNRPYGYGDPLLLDHKTLAAYHTGAANFLNGARKGAPRPPVIATEQGTKWNPVERLTKKYNGLTAREHQTASLIHADSAAGYRSAPGAVGTDHMQAQADDHRTMSNYHRTAVRHLRGLQKSPPKMPSLKTIEVRRQNQRIHGHAQTGSD